MQKDKKELNVKDMEKVSGGLRTEYLNKEELATYLRLKEAADKFQAVAANKTDDFKELAAVAFKSLKAGWEEAKKTFDQEKK